MSLSLSALPPDSQSLPALPPGPSGSLPGATADSAPGPAAKPAAFADVFSGLTPPPADPAPGKKADGPSASANEAAAALFGGWLAAVVPVPPPPANLLAAAKVESAGDQPAATDAVLSGDAVANSPRTPGGIMGAAKFTADSCPALPDAAVAGAAGPQATGKSTVPAALPSLLTAEAESPPAGISVVNLPATNNPAAGPLASAPASSTPAAPQPEMTAVSAEAVATVTSAGQAGRAARPVNRAAVSPIDRGAKIAAGSTRMDRPIISAVEAADKKILNVSDQQVAEHESDLGIGIAKTDSDMPAATFTHHQSTPGAVHGNLPDTTAAATFEVSTRAAEQPATDVVSAAHRAVDAVLSAADRFNPGDRHAFNLQFSFGGTDLNVRVELRGDEVRATFRTDSSELRTALAHEWQAVSADTAERPLRLAAPVFTSSGASAQAGFSSDSAPHQRNSGARDTQEQFFATTSARPRSASPFQPAAPRPVLAALGTALHLHTLA